MSADTVLNRAVMILTINKWSYIHCHVSRYKDRNRLVSSFYSVVHGKEMCRVWNRRWWWKGVHHLRLLLMWCHWLGIITILITVILGCFTLTIIQLLMTTVNGLIFNREEIVLTIQTLTLNQGHDQNQKVNHRI